ncbi:MAG: hypothetical protein O3A25_18920 [Acidobacteria bacterium]|nr:hypothetical protein [Acidobacteriota bacterium]
MAATTTLATTTLTYAVGAGDRAVTLGSTSGVVPGVQLHADRELLQVVSVGLGTSVNVLRGRGGTSASRHTSGVTATIGQPDQFYSSDPQGLPAIPPLVSPWINVLTGDQWLAQGDETGASVEGRWWQKVASAYSIGALGVSAPVANTP